MSERNYLTAAVLLDFDNVFISLGNLSSAAADRLYRRTQSWLDWFRAGFHTGDPDAAVRRIVTQRVYLNPATFSEQRAAFTRGGFETVDCPALTTQGKNSADIVMVMDIIDLLGHETKIDEFIILSADADFAPVLQRVRLHDRLATVYSNPVTAAALKNSASFVVDQERFIEEALGVSIAEEAVRARPNGENRTRISDPAEEVRYVAEQLEQELRVRGAVSLSQVGAAILNRYAPFQGSEWLGYRSMTAMLTKLIDANPRLQLDGQGDNQTIGAKRVDLDADESAAIEFMRAMVAESPKPIVAAKVVTELQRNFGFSPKETDWFGNGSLSAFVQNAGVERLAFSSTPPSHLFDPERHKHVIVIEEVRENLNDVSKELVDFIEIVNDTTGWPPLAPAQLMALFDVGAAAVSDGFVDRNGLSKEIRDRIGARIASDALERRYSISRVAVNFILTTVVHAGRSLSDCGTEEEFRDAAFAGFVNLYERTVRELTKDERSDIGYQLFSIPTARS